MIYESFSEGDSRLHRLDPRIKLLFVAAFSLIAAFAVRFETIAILALVPVAGVFAARLSRRAVAARLALVNLFILFLWIIVPFSVQGRVVWRAGPLAATAEGIRFAALITARSNAIVLAMTVFLGTSNLISLAHAMSHFRAPDKLTHLFFFTYRYIHVIHEEWLRMRGALTARAFQPRADLHTYKTFGYLVGMLLARSHWRARRIHWAMLCRGFYGHFAPLEHFEWRRRDALLGAGLAGCALLAAWLEWGR